VAVAVSPAEAIRIAAREAVVAAGAVKPCPIVMIRTGNEQAEHSAYVLATTALKREGAMDWRREILNAELAAAVEECPVCCGSLG
jgi:hypothetical protein